MSVPFRRQVGDRSGGPVLEVPPLERALMQAFSLPLTLVALLATATPAETQESEAASPLAELEFLVGAWEGAVDGALGQGRALREYELVLDDLFIVSRHASVRLPQEESPEGDHHRELGVFSFDGTRQIIVYRQFVVEGFVNRYACQPHGDGRLGFTCVTEAVENGPDIRARWSISAENEFVVDEEFSLAEPGEDFTLLFTNRWVRRPSLN